MGELPTSSVQPHWPLRTPPQYFGPKTAYTRDSYQKAGHTIDLTVVTQAILQAITNPSLGHAVNLLARPNLEPSQFGRVQRDSGMVLNRPSFDMSYHFNPSQLRETPPVPIAPTYTTIHQLTSIYPAVQPATLSRNPWVPSAQVDAKYLSLENQVKVLRGSLQNI
ncbi:hypothetical protein AMTR_s00052p00068830 [Amborella trichopoda]|uniref:Uncharacterized protein n=1 Tax=Amborella trichopoda TaxID=13333 RepID=U5D4L4_AMBTC|nr:hypothetical protein AMTR_s00052p00068830 [Amborella trichopoda]